MYTLGVVPYLNALPLVSDLPPGVDCREGDPGVISRWLAEGSVDAALLPVAEAFRGVGGPFVSRYGIACDGAVESVLLFLPRDAPPAEWPKDVVLDPASRTSAALVRVLLEKRHGLAPRYVTAQTAGPDPGDRPEALTLVIGDRAMAHRRTWPGAVLDLGLAWKEWTGLPFVFARWTSRAGLSPEARESLARTLDGAAQRGLFRRDELARTHGPAHGLSPAEAKRYLSVSIRFALGDRAEAGLARFREEWARLDASATP